MKILVTGGCGFIGANFVLHMIESDPQCEIVNFDALTYAGNLGNLASIADNLRHQFVRGDICAKSDVEAVLDSSIDAVVHFAAESHVDRSVEGPDVFLRTNILGTQLLLERMRQLGRGRFVMIAGDVVRGFRRCARGHWMRQRQHVGGR